MGKLNGQVAIVTGAVIPIDGGLVRGSCRAALIPESACAESLAVQARTLKNPPSRRKPGPTCQQLERGLVGPGFRREGGLRLSSSSELLNTI